MSIVEHNKMVHVQSIFAIVFKCLFKCLFKNILCFMKSDENVQFDFTTK